MRLDRVRGENFRCLETLNIEPHSRLNVFVGPNTAGKSSLLEAVYSLSRGRSFRGAAPGELAGPAGRHWAVRAAMRARLGPALSVGCAWDGQSVTLRAGGLDASAAEQARRLPMQLVDPLQHRLLEDGPSYRRRYLDWGVFQCEPTFLDVWRRYQRALRQRNRALREGSRDDVVQAWDAELTTSGETIAEQRRQHVLALQPRFEALAARLLGEGAWSLILADGWPAVRPLAQALAEHWDQDRRQAQTGLGPHRAELRVRWQERGVRHRVSRGQQKLLMITLALAQAGVVAAAAGQTPVLLVDDFGAELGVDYQQRLGQALGSYPGQVLVTALEAPAALTEVAERQMFHVEHGRVRAIP